MINEYLQYSFHLYRYPHYDDSPSFSDFVPFGGWTRPAIKQYEGDATVCGVDVDKDWYWRSSPSYIHAPCASDMQTIAD